MMDEDKTRELSPEFQVYRGLMAEIGALKAENARLLAIAEAAREWTRINHDAEDVSQDEAIWICDRLQEATEKWMSAQQAASHQADG